jgi:peroxiredoxin
MVVLLASCGASPPEWQAKEGRELLGKPAPAWPEGMTWINSGPRTLEELRGKVILLRFWLTDCAYCTATAPALNELHATYGSRGLVVLGFHHPKSKRTRDVEVVRAAVRDLGFRFPVALDDDWEALNRYWFPNGEQRAFTSVSFLIDRGGVIRWIHDGGEYPPGSPACRQLRREVERLL